VAFSLWFRGRFAVKRLLPRFGTVGAPLQYTIQVHNQSGKRQVGLSVMDDLLDQWPSFEDWLASQAADQKHFRSFRISSRKRTNPFVSITIKETPLPAMLPGQEVEISTELTPLRRGTLQFRSVLLARTDPLGLFRSFARLLLPQSVLVLPRRYPVPEIALPGVSKYQEGGVALASSVGQSDEFVALRDYRYGDPLRHIHWRSWAKAGKPVVKEFEDEFFVRHALVLDTFIDHPYSEIFEEAVSVAASVACTIQTQESLLDLLFVGPESYCFTAGRGLAHSDQMLEVLASVRACPDKTFGTLEHLVLNHVKVVSGCLCVLLAWDEARQQFVRKLHALGLPVLVFVVVPRGKAQVDPGPMSEEPGRFFVLELGNIESTLALLR
jgi:uncharacterized protein (DUF58 family)